MSAPTLHCPAPLGSPWLRPDLGDHIRSSRQQKPPLCYGAEIVEKRHKSLSQMNDSLSKAEKVGLLERTIALWGLLSLRPKLKWESRCRNKESSTHTL